MCTRNVTPPSPYFNRKEKSAQVQDAKDVDYSDTESEEEGDAGTEASQKDGGRGRKKSAQIESHVSNDHEDDPTEEDNAEVHGKIIEFVTQVRKGS